MKKVNLLDILGSADNKIINRAIETDNAEKLKELKTIEKRKKQSILLRYLSLFSGGFAVFMIGILLYNNSIDNNVLTSNPMIEVKNINELGEYINLNLSKYEIKKIGNMYKFENEELIQITYIDESILRISKEIKDNSGICGAVLDKTEKINGIDVNIYKLDNIFYAVWNDDNYAFSYVFNNSENTTEMLSKLV